MRMLDWARQEIERDTNGKVRYTKNTKNQDDGIDYTIDVEPDFDYFEYIRNLKKGE